MSNTEKNWGDDPLRAPTLQDGDIIIIDACGRVINNVCYRSHYFRLVGVKHGGSALLVKHGGGEQRINLKWPPRQLIEGLRDMEPEAQYLALHLIHKISGDAARDAAGNTAKLYEQAFVDGRLKKRKMPRQQAVKVWIEPAHG